MSVGNQGARRFAQSQVLSRDSICTSCRNRISHQISQRRSASSAAAAVAESPSINSSTDSPPQSATASAPRKAFRLMCSPVISRPPLLTRELTSFEKAYYLYQKRLNERLVLPFTRYFYYKKGTPSDIEWKKKIKARLTPARDVGAYNAYGREGWNDEVIVGSKLSEPEDIVEKIIRDAEGKHIMTGQPISEAKSRENDDTAVDGTKKPAGELAVERPLARETEADRQNDVRSLDRKLDRSLYLLVKNKDGRWRFPEDRVYGRESLHQATERILLQAGGINMNTWVVANHPVGHYAFSFQKPVTSTIPPHPLVGSSTQELQREEFGEKVFFMKTRIMAGQLDLTKNEYGDQEFQWLTKEEIQAKVSKLYWSYIKNMLVDR